MAEELKPMTLEERLMYVQGQIEAIRVVFLTFVSHSDADDKTAARFKGLLKATLAAFDNLIPPSEQANFEPMRKGFLEFLDSLRD